MDDVLIIYRVENGWLISVGDGVAGKPSARRMVTNSPDHLGMLVSNWAYNNLPSTLSGKVAPPTDADGILELDTLRFPVTDGNG
jgi:hypothetical protein